MKSNHALRGDTSYDVGEDSITIDMVKGAVAGAIGVWVMDRVDWYMYDHVDPEARRRTRAARPGGLDPAHVVANEVAGATGSELSPPQPQPADIAVHYALGIGPGAAYGALRDRVPGVGAGRGVLWGLGLFAIQDELLNAVSGLSGPPRLPRGSAAPELATADRRRSELEADRPYRSDSSGLVMSC